MNYNYAVVPYAYLSSAIHLRVNFFQILQLDFRVIRFRQ